MLGVTGAFVTAPSGLQGYLVAEGRNILVDEQPLGGFREAKRAARWLRGKLVGIGASTAEVAPAIVLTRAHAGASREHAGVLVLRLEDVVPTITGRERVLTHRRPKPPGWGPRSRDVHPPRPKTDRVRAGPA